jgi:biotin transporter BioY
MGQEGDHVMLGLASISSMRATSKRPRPCRFPHGLGVLRGITPSRASAWASQAWASISYQMRNLVLGIGRPDGGPSRGGNSGGSWIGALGFDVFAGSSAELAGWTYMTGSTGGYLLGFVLATLALGWAARRGLDRSVAGMAGAMAVGMALIYLPGVLWLGVLYGWNEPILAWGLYPFLIGDALKLGLAALIVPGLWRLVGAARG